MSMTRVSCFFSHSAAPHPDLHSFPTRRSSDLFGIAPGQPPSMNPTPNSSSCRAMTSLSATLRLRPRSEEHTSELQSRGHLVCRLLLEKKQRRAADIPHEEWHARMGGAAIRQSV